MSLICFTFTTWVTEEVLEPVETWVSQQQQVCEKLPWWNPLKWLCWFVTVLVKVIIWVVRYIVVPVLNTICNFITWVLGWFALIIAIIIDAVCPTCNAVHWVNLWFHTAGRVTYVSQQPSATPGEIDYTFTCHCRKGDTTIVVTAPNDDVAARKAREECIKTCA